MEPDNHEGKPFLHPRHRSPIFSKEEVHAFLNIIKEQPFKSILLNKSISADANHAKEVAWAKIAKIFNKQGFMNVRTAENLKIKWENLKKRTRQASKNLLNAQFSESKGVVSQMVAMLSEAENNTSAEKPVDSDSECNSEKSFNAKDPDLHEELINDSHCNDDKDSDESMDDEINEIRSRHRSPAFSKEEVQAFLNIIKKQPFKSILLNKSISADANHAKEVAWSKIVKIYNNQGFKHFRTVENLKIKWLNLKKRTRQASKNLLNAQYSECEEVVSQVVSMLSEAENNTSVEKPVESDSDCNSEKSFNAKGPDLQEDFSLSINDSHCNDIDHKDFDESMDDNETHENRRRYNRSIKFSPKECHLLLQCVRPEKYVVLSKTITKKINTKKNLAWRRIANSYNKLCSQKRSANELRTKFTNMKVMAMKGNFKNYNQKIGKKHDILEDSGNNIKIEPEYESRDDVELDIDDDINGYGINQNSDNHNHVNPELDPLSTVLSTDSGISSINLPENLEVAKLKLQLLNYKLETAKLQRKRIEELVQGETAERETKSIENSMRLRAARLELIAAEMKLPSTHPALAYTEEESRAQHYMHQYHAT